ncbi:MAG: TonB-dependent receptor [Alistipes sp.]|nr:TonB-dependent receptor [Alistipes sp.]
MNRKFLFTSLFVFSVLGTLRAQNIQGTVYGAEDGEPLIGASVYWAETTVGTSTDADGAYGLHRLRGYDRLVASYLGYANDTIRVASDVQRVDFRLRGDGIAIDEVVVNSTLGGNYVKRDGILKGEMISFAGLCKMACCNLAESFENSASVTVGYSDAISGARQIKMLGLAGTYTQILDENRPIMRGLSAPYGLSYTPGMWLNSIQVSKGVSSVTAGHEAITGQINLEHRKPTDDERLFINFYVDDELRPELNLSTALPVTKDKKLTTVLLLHGSLDTHLLGGMDDNKDGFMDLPKTRLGAVSNRWLYTADNGAQVRWGVKYLAENRLSGQHGYKASMREMVEQQKIYGSQIKNREMNAYFKFGMPVGPGVYDDEEQDELRSNVAFVADYDRFRERAYFGLNDYDGTDNMVSLNAMYNHYFTARHALIVGVQSHLQFLDERLTNATPWLAGTDPSVWTLDRQENEVGAYAEYTYTIKDKFSLVAGVRGDYNSYYDKMYLTPRGHIKWNITPTTILRGSAGMGYRSTNVITDNIGILATGRRIVFAQPAPAAADLPGRVLRPASFDGIYRMEKALTAGGSLTQIFTLVKEEDATLSFDYFRTQFFNSVVADQEYSADDIMIYSTDGTSFTDTYQVDFSWTPIERFDIFATFRYTNSRMTIDRPDGSTALVERPLVSRYKALINLQYATRYRRWVFDVTAQLNGPSRLPTQTGNLADSSLSPVYPMFFAQVTRKVGKFDIYLGCENILDYKQKHPILNAGDPFSTGFNSSVVWGPLMGRKIYAGLRINFY